MKINKPILGVRFEFFTSFSLAAAMCAFAADYADDPRAMQGNWKPVQAELGGQPMADEVLKIISLKLDHGQYEVLVGEQPDRGTYTLDPATEPKSVTVTGTSGPNQGRTFPAIYELTDDVLRICYDLSGAKRPTEFKTVAGTKLYLVRYHRKSEPAAKPGWKLTFQDEFDGAALDLSKWNPRDPWGRERNHELQAYVTNAFEVKEGVLRIRAEKQTALYSGKERAYTSGMMTTYQKFSQTYGRFEIRCRLPKGKGLWPAFWLLPEPLAWPPEIDVLEILGHEPTKVYCTHHFQDEQGKHKSDGASWTGPDFSVDFHEFAVEWSPERIVWLVDGVEHFKSERSIPHGKMYMLINLAVGGGWPGDPDEKTVFPSALEVDYVRAYEKSQL